MIRKEDIIADMHTHTLASKHAYSTLKENLDIARKNGIKYIAITDHFYNDGTDIEKKNEIGRICYVENENKRLKDIEIIGGAEFNIGQKIYSWKKLSNLRWRPIGVHSWFYNIPNGTLNELYDLYVRASEKHNAFVHIERELHKIENKAHPELDINIKKYLEKIVILAKEKNIFLEVNESSILTNECNGIDRMKYWLSIAKENGNLIYLGTDAHFCEAVGDFTNVINLLNEINYPKDLILNINENLLKEEILIYKK